ncbi:MAG: cysteine desulfurase IscS [Candidatus Poribacteria bacterium]|nr:MAG: cysteine desulfurase IscS [Candidatus Poribacteria bacterium]
MVKTPIYMDYHATTPLDPRVLEAMRPYLTEEFGNASSGTHRWGWHAEEAVETARQQLADVLGCRPDEVIFTSGATESNNLAIKGVAWAYRERGKDHLITSQAEHSSVLDTCKWLESEGFSVTYLPVDRYGRVDPDDVRRAITPRTALITLMWANNEVGTLNPISEIGAIAQEADVLFHTDGVQAFAKYDSRVDRLGVDLMSLSGHKIYGPKGIGALYVRKRRPRVRIVPLLHGGGHERGLRSGTLNVPGIVGLGAAAQLCAQLREEEQPRIQGLRDQLWRRLQERIDLIHLNGHPTERLYNNLNVLIEFVEGEALLMSAPDVALSTGSACHSASTTASHVLVAMGLDESAAHSAVRFGLGRWNTPEEVEYVAEYLAEKVAALRRSSPAYAMKRRGLDIYAS